MEEKETVPEFLQKAKLISQGAEAVSIFSISITRIRRYGHFEVFGC